MSEPRYFENAERFHKWLAKNHALKTELLVGFYKVDSDKASMTWPESVDAALCFGWIDGVRKSAGPDSYTIRFTPRKRASIWSLRNVERVAVLTAEGRMAPAGLAAFEARSESKTGVYAFESDEVTFSDAEEKRFRESTDAWRDWQARPPSYRKQATHWVVSAKKEETRERRLDHLLESCAEGRKIKPMRSAGE